jgi:hypothetical protein
LGVLRTQELLAARRIDAGEQYFTRAIDLGYSKIPEETFFAAADPNRFSVQLKYVSARQAIRLLGDTYQFGDQNTTSEDQFKIDVGAYNLLLGKSYGEIAAESRSMHLSQAFGTARQRASHWEYFKTILGDAPYGVLPLQN